MEKSVKEIVAEIKEKMDKLGGLKHVYFVACGGSKAAIFPGLYLLQSEAKTLALLHIPAMNLFMQHQKNWMSGASQLFVH